MSDHRVFAALADESRRRILLLLATESLSVNEIAGHFAVTRPAVSHHLRVLKEAGLVDEQRSANRRLYRLVPETLDIVVGFCERIR